MAWKDLYNKYWGDKTEGEKIGMALSYTGALGTTIAPYVTEMWDGDKAQLDAIKKAQADALNSPYNTATVTPETKHVYDLWANEYAKAVNEAKFGLSAEEKAKAYQDYATSVNMNEQNALNAGGGQLAPYVNAVLNTGANKFATDINSKDAELKRVKKLQVLNYLSGMQGAAGAYQDVFNQNFNKQLLTEQALGQAEADWRINRATDRRALVSTGGAIIGAAGKSVI